MASQTSSSKNSDIKLKAISLNVRGLRNNKKRKTLFHKFKKNDYDIVCLQETYLLKNDINLIKKDWGSLFHIVEGTKRSKGLLTLFNSKFKDSNIAIIKENERCLISEITIDDMNFTLLNVYAPCINTEKNTFFRNIANFVNELQQNPASNLLIFGDFNTVLNNQLDIISGENHNVNIVNSFNNLVNDLFVVDIWRHLHGNKKEFSWNKEKPFIARRLDYILVSEDLLPFCKDSNIVELGFSAIIRQSPFTLIFHRLREVPPFLSLMFPY